MTSDIPFAIKHLPDFPKEAQCGRQMDVWGSAEECEWSRDACAAQAQRSLASLRQQAIEDLQSEEEKVILLTKEKTKLQMQAEDVSSSFYSLIWYGCFLHLHGECIENP